ncbi:V-set and immunoglobulin domain-containing protein 10 [Trichomycterus rosablanca]|uniref:V-set and immunoglobulin domain-containing protein 10 n=1 Tax=Trichomycterus rosablanca TaxID=2290929 RepID=UPI002F351BD5
MEIPAVPLLLCVLLYYTAFADEQLIITAELNKKISLPCLERPANTTFNLTHWFKGGSILTTRNHSKPVSSAHVSVQNDSSLFIGHVMLIDEEVYQCDPQPRSSNSSRKIFLQVTGDPKFVQMNVTAATSLGNGTWFVKRGSDVSINCKSSPMLNLTMTFKGINQSEFRRGYRNGKTLDFNIQNVQPEEQGNYTCNAQNLLSTNRSNQTVELLVYYASEKHPDCIWHPTAQPDHVYFNCSWKGCYPAPTLKVHLESKEDSNFTLIGSQMTENFELILNRSMVFEGQRITCVGEHIVQNQSDKKFCTFTIEPPYPTGNPMVAALEGTNVTLTCIEVKSLPPAKTVWQRGIKHNAIEHGFKYILGEQGPSRTLTIVNVSKDDEGVYFCRSENVLAASELEVYLTVRSSGANSGAVVGVFISLLIVASGVALGYFLYSRRDRICLDFRCGHLQSDNSDVMSLVESDEDEVFQNAVPRLPSLVNGHGPAQATTLVEIHRIQSSDHEDNVNGTDQDRTRLDEI